VEADVSGGRPERLLADRHVLDVIQAEVLDQLLPDADGRFEGDHRTGRADLSGAHDREVPDVGAHIDDRIARLQQPLDDTGCRGLVLAGGVQDPARLRCAGAWRRYEPSARNASNRHDMT
jgi:hypothetical protein